MKAQQQIMRPQDIVVLLKIITSGEKPWSQLLLADALFMSQSEISQCLSRSKYAGLMPPNGKKVNKQSLMELIIYGIKYVFPQQPGAIVRGVPTAFSAPPMNTIIQSEEKFVWPSGRGAVRGQGILPLYPSVTDAVKLDSILHELLALVDVLRIGRAREREIAIHELKKRII